MQDLVDCDGLRSAILNPLNDWRHEFIVMPEWDGRTVAVREPSLDDRFFWLEPLSVAAHTEAEDSPEALRAKYEGAGAGAHTRAYARLFVRVLHVETANGWRRLFTDDDADLIASAYGATHDRIVSKAVELGRLGVDPVEDGKKPLAETPACDSN